MRLPVAMMILRGGGGSTNSTYVPTSAARQIPRIQAHIPSARLPALRGRLVVTFDPGEDANATLRDQARVRVVLKAAVNVPAFLGSIVNVPSPCLVKKQRCFGTSPRIHTS